MSDTASQTAALLALLSRFDVAEFDYRDATRHIRVTGGQPAAAEPAVVPAPASPAPSRPPAAGGIRSPGVGRFHATDRRDMPRAVAKGDVLGTLKTGLVLTPVVAPFDGLLVAIRHDDGTGVGYDTLLFDIDRTGRG